MAFSHAPTLSSLPLALLFTCAVVTVTCAPFAPFAPLSQLSPITPLQMPDCGPIAPRLIATSPTNATWLCDEAIAKLIARDVGFMDITAHPDIHLRAQQPIRPAATIPRAPRFQNLVRPLLPALSSVRLNATVAQLSAYPSRYYKSDSGAEAALWLATQYKELAAARSDVSVRTVKHAFVQQSVIARIEGDGSSDEVVVIGAHLDSISSGSTAPGADDDASGSATLLEVFRVLIESGYKPKRPIEFQSYAGEEAGLLGSQDIAADYFQRKISVASMAQFDMTCYPGTQGSRVIGVINDFVDLELTRFLESIIDTYTTATHTPYTCGYGCSDHASYHRVGYRSSHPFEAPKGQSNPFMHTTRDTFEKCDLVHAGNFLNIALAYVIEMSAATD
eukprot:TRINITY_DN1417_c0_g1_i1.p1 TRINITY_DN1417_c0_g1~~TRINITY_DN1417_c0_g1_i1.p1  ORF type:complete len:391 (+),score=88.38 TRINITY_DN1417_c0_g1_i1:48-1220(+)